MRIILCILSMLLSGIAVGRHELDWAVLFLVWAVFFNTWPKAKAR